MSIMFRFQKEKVFLRVLKFYMNIFAIFGKNIGHTTSAIGKRGKYSSNKLFFCSSCCVLVVVKVGITWDVRLATSFLKKINRLKKKRNIEKLGITLLYTFAFLFVF